MAKPGARFFVLYGTNDNTTEMKQKARDLRVDGHVVQVRTTDRFHGEIEIRATDVIIFDGPFAKQIEAAYSKSEGVTVQKAGAGEGSGKASKGGGAGKASKASPPASSKDGDKAED